MFRECGARERTRGHQSCRQPAMMNGRCRLHGELSTGPRTKAGKQRMKEANTKHGHYSWEALQMRRELSAVLRFSKGWLHEIVSS